MHSREFGNMPFTRALLFVAATTVILSLILMVVRISDAMSFTYPVHVVTSGWEQESLFAMWKYVHGMAVYDDPYSIPYSIAFFNWLFYEFYGTYVALVKNVLNTNDEWLPTIARSATFIGLVVGVVFSYKAFLATSNAQSKPLRILSLAFAVYLMFGPLVGYWGITVRSDIWGMVLEVGAVYVFWKFSPKRPYLAVVLTAIMLFGAWSFKQVDVFSAIAVGLYLLFHLKIKPLILLTFTYFAFVAAVIVFATDEYIETIFFRPAIYGFDFAHLLRNLQNFIIKSTPALFPLAVIFVAIIFSSDIRRAVWANQAGRFFAISILPLFLVVLLTSSKVGAAENYYFAFSFYAAASVIVFLKIVFEDEALQQGRSFTVFRNTTVNVMILGWGTASVAVSTVLFGFNGITSLQSQHERHTAIQACLQKMPLPVYVPNMYASLPWINLSDPPIVLSWNYRLERRLGLEFERDGVGGLINDGHFESLLLSEPQSDQDGMPKDMLEKKFRSGPISELDGGSLNGYRNTGQKCAGHVIFLKK